MITRDKANFSAIIKKYFLHAMIFLLAVSFNQAVFAEYYLVYHAGVTTSCAAKKAVYRSYRTKVIKHKVIHRTGYAQKKTYHLASKSTSCISKSNVHVFQ